MLMNASKFERESTKFETAKILDRHGDVCEVRYLTERLTWDEVSDMSLDKSICLNIACDPYQFQRIDNIAENTICGEDFMLLDLEYTPIGVLHHSGEILVQVGAFVAKAY